MWVYGPGEVVYDQCTFTNNTKGKLLHLYCEGTDSQHKVTVKDCKFVNGGEESKAAINVKATSGSNALQYELHLEGNNTYEGNFPTAVGEQANADKTWILSPLAQVDDRKVNPDNIKVYEIFIDCSVRTRLDRILKNRCHSDDDIEEMCRRIAQERKDFVEPEITKCINNIPKEDIIKVDNESSLVKAANVRIIVDWIKERI
jgi:hypothetical protein